MMLLLLMQLQHTITAAIHMRRCLLTVYIPENFRVQREVTEENVSAAVKTVMSQNEELKITSSQEAGSIKPALYHNTDLLNNCIFIPAEQFDRIDELSFSVSVPDYKGLLGIYCARVPGKNEITVFCESKLICSYSEDFDHSFTQEMIFLFDKEQLELSGNIKVVFNTPEQAESFRGLIVSIV